MQVPSSAVNITTVLMNAAVISCSLVFEQFPGKRGLYYSNVLNLIIFVIVHYLFTACILPEHRPSNIIKVTIIY